VGSTPIQQAKLKLPLPLLMQQLGLGEHARRNARCPFHEDSNPSFSIFQIGSAWFFKCHTGCGTGDEINFLEKYRGVTRSEAIEIYLEMAGCAPLPRSFWRKPSGVESESLKSFDWMACVESLTDNHLERLGNQRWYSRAFCAWLRDNRLVGLHKNCIAFPVHKKGTVVGVHYCLEDGSWRYHPQGTKAAPLIIGDLATSTQVHLFESQWDMFAFIDRTESYSSETVTFIATRGAGNARSIYNLLPEGVSICAWPQNDSAGEKWLSDLCAEVKVNIAVVPQPYKDLNDWTKAGANKEVVSAAFAEAAKERSNEFGLNKSMLPDLASVLEEITCVLRRNITFSSEHQAVVVALWIAHTHVIDRLNITPYLHITSPVKRCGKSNLLACLKYLTFNAWHVVNPSVAVLYRKIESDCPTLLLDEADRSFEGGESGRQDLLAILHSGYKRGATVYRCGGANRDRLESFAVFCPKAFAGIGELPDTTQDRCLPIRLERQVRGQRRRFLEDHVEREMAPIRDRLANWAKTEDAKNTLSITILDWAFPESLSDRAVEVCESLFKIAIAAGGDWYKRTREATAFIFGAEEDENQATSQLAAIRNAFREDDRLSTSELIDRLLDGDDSPFPNWWLKETDKKVIGKSLAKILKPFGVRAKKFRIDGEQVRGYECLDLEPVWERYCTPSNVAHAETSDLDVLDVSLSVTPNSQLLKAGHLVSPELRSDFSCPKLSFRYPTIYREWDICDIKNEKERVG
jgi:hypothetical protein